MSCDSGKISATSEARMTIFSLVSLVGAFFVTLRAGIRRTGTVTHGRYIFFVFIARQRTDARY